METGLKKMIGLWAGTVLALVLGMLVGFFFVFNSIFSDIFSLNDRLLSFVLIFGVYAILGASLGAGSPKHVRRWMWLLTTPGFIIVVLYTLGEPNIPLHALVLAIMFAGAYSGLRVGRVIRGKRK